MPSVRLLIDATALPADKGGVGRYVEGLLGALNVLAPDSIVVCQQRDADAYRTSYARLRIEPIPARYRRRALRLVWEQIGLPRLARRTRSSVVLSPHYTMPLLGRFRRVVTLHDATFFSDPDVHLRLKARFFRTWIRTAFRRADAVVVPSAATATELERFVRTRRAAIYVAHHGVDSEIFHPPTADEISNVRALLGVGDRPYVAFLGTLEPRKNVPALVSAMSIVARRLGGAPPVVLAGSDGWDAEIDAAVTAVSHDITVLRPGYLPIDRLRAFLASATAFVYPSLGEGFGLPVIEAMASGACVITTRRLALPEVGGDAVLYTDVDAESIAEAIVTALSGDGENAPLREAAIERARQFTWSASARVHLAAAGYNGGDEQ